MRETKSSVEVETADSGREAPDSAENAASKVERFWSPARRKLLGLVLGIKAATFLLALGAITFFPAFNQREYTNDIHWPREGPPTIALSEAQADGNLRRPVSYRRPISGWLLPIKVWTG